MAAKRKTKKSKPCNRKAQEATLINNDARKKEIAALRRAVAELNEQFKTPRWKVIEERLDNQERTIVGLQTTVKRLVEDGTAAQLQAAIDSLKSRLSSLEGRANE